MNESILKRFYITLIIYELWKNSKSIWHVSSEFQLERGFVQQIIQSSASFTSGVLHFCENLDEFWPYTNLLHDLMKRLQYNCSKNELLEIMVWYKQLFHSKITPNLTDFFSTVFYRSWIMWDCQGPSSFLMPGLLRLIWLPGRMLKIWQIRLGICHSMWRKSLSNLQR